MWPISYIWLLFQSLDHLIKEWDIFSMKTDRSTTSTTPNWEGILSGKLQYLVKNSAVRNLVMWSVNKSNYGNLLLWFTLNSNYHLALTRQSECPWRNLTQNLSLRWSGLSIARLFLKRRSTPKPCPISLREIFSRRWFILTPPTNIWMHSKHETRT